MLARMKRKGLTLSAATAIVVAAAVTAAPAGAAFHTFKGDRGTTCQIEVGAFASDSLGALSGPPNVGYSAVPTCHYPATSKSGAPKKGRKACRKHKAKRGKRGKKRCGRKKKQGARRGAAAEFVASPANVPLAEILSARLELLGPAGNVTSVGEQTMQAPALGYSCTVGVGIGATTCKDTGRLLPAIPGSDYTAEFSVRVEPPAGEAWTTRPAGCSPAPVPACELRSATVSPKL
jgi:hypothetical protein